MCCPGAAGAYKLYVDEAREEAAPQCSANRSLCWLVSFVYLILGTIVLGSILLEGMQLDAFHGMCIFIAVLIPWVAPRTQNIMYYHVGF